jgi:hypothetical protein
MVSLCLLPFRFSCLRSTVLSQPCLRFDYNHVCGSIACDLWFSHLSLSRYKGRVQLRIYDKSDFISAKPALSLSLSLSLSM